MLSKKHPQIEADGTTIVIVHMGTEEQGAQFLPKFGLADVAHISNPSQSLDQAAELRRAEVEQLLNMKVLIRGLSAIRFGTGAPVGDSRQMPGAFLIHRGKSIREFRHTTPADRIDFFRFAKG